MRLIYAFLIGLVAAVNDPPLILPPPTTWTADDGVFTLSEKTNVVYADDVAYIGDRFVQDVKALKSWTLPAKKDSPAKGDITLELDASKQLGDQAYTLTIADQVTLVAETEAGLAYGTQSILQLLTLSNDLPKGTITDVPQQGIRGYEVDCARHYWKMDTLRDIIRKMGWMKMNMLIMHCADAEAFRFDSDKFPGLAPSGYSYSKDDITDLVKLAKSYGIQIVPGFEFPGHNTVFNRFFNIGLTSDCQEHVYAWVTYDWVSDMTESEALESAQAVLAEIVPWFESDYVHLGADELPDSLKDCSTFVDFMSNNAKYGSFGDVACEWVNNLIAWVKTNLKVDSIVFNGLEESVSKIKLTTDAIVHIWTKNDFTDKTFAKGYKVLVTDPADKVFYLTPNAYHYIFPDPDYMVTSWEPTVTTYETVIGSAMAQWGDYIYWMDDYFAENEAELRRAIIASKIWNKDTASYSSLEGFKDLYKRVATTIPNVKGPIPSHAVGDLRHYYSFAAAKATGMGAWNGNLNGCTENLCIPVEDLVGGLHGSTYISTDTQKTNAKSNGELGQGLEWMDNGWSKQGLGFGGIDIPAPWTYALWLNLTEAVSPSVLAFSRYGAIMLSMSQDDKSIGISDFNTSKDCSFKDGFPVDSKFHHMAIVNDQTATTLYIDGDKKGSVDCNINLPMLSIGGYVHADASAYAAFYGAVDELRMYDSALSPERIYGLIEAMTPTYDGASSNILLFSFSIFISVAVLAII